MTATDRHLVGLFVAPWDPNKLIKLWSDNTWEVVVQANKELEG